mgnify:CR=1 FL=1
MKAKCPRCGSMEKVRNLNGERVFARHTRKFSAYAAFTCEGAGKAASDAAVLAWAKGAEDRARETLTGRDGEVSAFAQRRAEKIAEAEREYEGSVARCDERCEAAKANLRALEKLRAKLSRPQTPATRTDTTDNGGDR